MTEAGVSDVYVQLGNDFNAAVAAFSQYNIEMRFVFSTYITDCSLMQCFEIASSCLFQMIYALSWKPV